MSAWAFNEKAPGLVSPRVMKLKVVGHPRWNKGKAWYKDGAHKRGWIRGEGATFLGNGPTSDAVTDGGYSEPRTKVDRNLQREKKPARLIGVGKMRGRRGGETASSTPTSKAGGKRRMEGQ